ncbi:MAG: hypothetical protein Q9191_005956 [Dirinaria sp. TL-2023a]
MSGFGGEQVKSQEQASTTMDFETMDFDNPFNSEECMADLLSEDYLYAHPFSNFDTGIPYIDAQAPIDQFPDQLSWPDSNSPQDNVFAEASQFGANETFAPANDDASYYPPIPMLDSITQPYHLPTQPLFDVPPMPGMPQDQLAQYYAAAAKYYADKAREFGPVTESNGHVSGEVSEITNSTGREAQSSQVSMEVDDKGATAKVLSAPAFQRLPKRKPASNPAANARVMQETLTNSGLQRFSKTNPENLKSRTRKILEYDPRAVYKENRAEPFENWGNCFGYTMDCELLPGMAFTVEEMNQYFFAHPRGFRMWIQRNPSDSKRRYGHSASARCRIKDCPADYRLIGQAQYRVAFDERYQETNYDPMHCAMYCHLFCLEKFFDFPALCAQLDVRAEDRELPKEPAGRNRMLFSTEEEKEIAQEFISACQHDKVPASYPRDGTHHGSLTHMLALKKVELEPKRISEARKERNARSTFEVHLGDLELENAERAKSRRPEWQTRRKPLNSPSSASAPKRKRVETDDEEEEVVAQPVRKSAKKAPTTKKGGRKTAVPKSRKRQVVESSEDSSEESLEQGSEDEEYRPPTRSRTVNNRK